MAVSNKIGAGKTILVLEDDLALRGLVERVLKAYGFTVTAAVDGLQGLMELERMIPDLVIADVMMPNLDGTSFVKAIKTRSETREIPIIFLTAKTDPKSMMEGINVGARFYITKPFQIEDLVKKVQQAIEGE